MGVAVYVSQRMEDGTLGGELDYFPVAGATEIESFWKPLIETHELIWINQIIGAGVSIDAENHQAILDGLSIILAAMLDLGYDRHDPASPAARTGRLVDLIKDHHPDGRIHLYIG